MALMIRFKRVQVQLRAQEENTIKIMETIRRTTVLEVVFVVILVSNNILSIIGYLRSEVFDFSQQFT